MTFGAENEYLFTAYDIVNTWAEEDIANVIYAYGEEVLARKIARMIVEARVQGPITSSKQLAEIIEKKLGRGGVRFTKQGPKKITHPATKTFQALRIAVNNELEHLRTALEKAFALLKPQGVLAVISYHSLEDRIVKQYFKEWAKREKGIEYTKKPTVPNDEELQRNPRSRSAKLRIIIKQ
jgi:16S rRNA (cytosine1402-N4)-methyltransferase